VAFRASLANLPRVPDLFSPAGIAAWRARLDASDHFRDAARGWTGTVLLVEEHGTAPRATFLTVNAGTLTVARAAEAADHDAAEFVLRASGEVWDGLAAGRIELVTAALTGQLHLDKGQVLRLVPHARAASAMLREGGGS